MELNNKDAEQEVLEQLQSLYSYHAQEALRLSQKAKKGEPISEEALESQKILRKQIDQLNYAYKGIKSIQKQTGKKDGGEFAGLHEQIKEIKSNQGGIVGNVTEQ